MMGFCFNCEKSFPLAHTGRPPLYCSGKCRQSAYRKRKAEMEDNRPRSAGSVTKLQPNRRASKPGDTYIDEDGIVWAIVR